MSSLAQTYAAHRNHLGSKAPARVRRRCKIHLLELVRPDGYWPMPYTLEQAFGIFQWMVRTAQEHTHYNQSGPIELLSMNPSCINFRQVDPILGLEDLRRRFHYALLSNHASHHARQWRAKHQVHLGADLWLAFPHHEPYAGAPQCGYGCEADVKKALAELFKKAAGARLRVSLNSVHKERARWCKGISIHVSPAAFRFVIRYGYRGEGNWTHTVAESAEGEPFAATLRRASDALDAMLVRERKNH